MRELINFIKDFGTFSLDQIWFPLLVWTVCCAATFLFLRFKKNLNPLFHYHLRTAAILSLPLGIATSFFLQWVPQWLSASPIETAFFIIQNPIEVVARGPSSAVEIQSAWQDPSFFIGLCTIILVAGSFVMALRFANSYLELKKLYSDLEFTTNSGGQHPLFSGQNVELAFHDHPLVPFTFGWKKPVIVLPKILKEDNEKLNMALQHELIHIKRGDYLLQLALSIIQSIFWFHPLIYYGNQEIDTYREISCDQEVLSTSDFSIKSYASLLYELVPLKSGVSLLSVSMAVKNSNLKQRIKTMKYHKLHRTSFKQSIFFLLLMVIGITLPIACSDLRGPQGLTEEEIASSELNFNKATVSVNDIEILNMKEHDNFAVSLNYGMVFNVGDYGYIVLSGMEFDNAAKVAELQNNEISFKINELSFSIKNEGNFIDADIAQLWVRHFPSIKSPELTFKSIPYSRLKDNDYVDYLTAPLPPASASDDGVQFVNPPPSPNPPPEPTENDDFFVVVEEMPKPIGGMNALQSKVEYPEEALNEGIDGRVTVQFIVNEEGEVERAEVVRGIGGGADEEALRVVNETKFEPGLQRGKPVRVQFALSINFRLSDADFSTSEKSVEREKGSGL